MGEYKRRPVTCVEEAKIGNLPAHLTDSILDRLPVEEAVKTSILSKKWRYRWTAMRELVFDERFSNKFEQNGAFGRNGYIRIINQVVLLHKGPILKFHLHLPESYLDNFQEVDQWMLFLSRNGVTELTLTFLSRRYRLSSHVFSCVELRKLKLTNCILKRLVEFEGFPNLEDLDLRRIDFGDTNLSGTQIRLPKLKKLYLYLCSNAASFSIEATNLQSLGVVASPDVDPFFRVVGGASVTLFALQDFVGGEKMNMNMATGLSHLPAIKDVYIEGIYLKFLFAENVPKWLPHPVNSLESLRLRFLKLGDLDQLRGALCLLRNSPNLKQLHLEMDSVGDVGPALNHLEAADCLGCTLNQLQTVEIISLTGSKLEMVFLKLLFAHSPCLEKITITPSEDSDVEKRHDISTDVMQFPLASPKAKMFYLNP